MENYIYTETGIKETYSGMECLYGDLSNPLWTDYINWTMGKDKEYYRKIKEYHNWIDIVTYEDRLKEWELNPSTEKPNRPSGYFTLEEVEAVNNYIKDWEIRREEAALNNIEFTEFKPIPLKRPGDIPKPEYPKEHDTYREASNDELREILSNKAREKRSLLLEEVDLLILKKDDDNKSTYALKLYRSILRDITKQVTFPFYIQWPTLPKDFK